MTGMRMHALFLFLLLASGISFSQDAVCGQDVFSPAISYAAAGFLALAGIIAITYAAGEFLHHPRLLSWSKGEVAQLFTSAIIIALILQILSTFCSINVGSAVTLTSLPEIPLDSELELDFQAQDNTYTAAQKFLIYLQSVSYSSFSTIREKMGDNEKLMSKNLWKCENFCLLGGSGTSSSPDSGLQAANAALGPFLNSSAISLLTTLAQIALYNFLFVGENYWDSFLIFCLVAGTILRSIPFMRGLGGAMMGLSVSLYIFFPFLLMLEGLFFPALIFSLWQAGDSVSVLIQNATIIFLGAVFISSLNLLMAIAGISQVSGLLGQEVDASRIARLI